MRLDRITCVKDHNRNRTRAVLRRNRGELADGDDDINFRQHQFCDQGWQTFEMPLRSAFDQFEIGTDGKAALGELTRDIFRQSARNRVRSEASRTQETDAVKLGGLRLQGKYKEKCGCDNEDKTMHLHSITSSAQQISR